MKIQDIKNNIKEAIEVNFWAIRNYSRLAIYTLSAMFYFCFFADNSDSNGQFGTSSWTSQSREPVSNRLHLKFSEPDRLWFPTRKYWSQISCGHAFFVDDYISLHCSKYLPQKMSCSLGMTIVGVFGQC